MIRRTLAGLAVTACASGLAACGGGATRHPAATPPVRSLCIYVGTSPGAGPPTASAALLRGVRLALARIDWRAGRFSLKVCNRDQDDRPVPVDGDQSAAEQVASTAATAAQDPRTILYVGDVTTTATDVSNAILDDAGIAQIAPVPSRGPAEPGAADTLLALAPSATVLAAARRQAVRVAGCTRIVSRLTRGTGACWLRSAPNFQADGTTAVELLAGALRHLGGSGANRAAVLSALRGERLDGTPLGTVSFTGGYLAAYSFDLYRLGVFGRPVLIDTVDVR